MAWIEHTVAAHPEMPFFAYIAPKACHEPFLPAPWYEDFWDPSWPQGAPRLPNYNLTMEERADHHPTIAKMGLIGQDTASCIDDAFKNRWRTLMSVDDVITDVISLTQRLGVHENTYYIYSSGQC